MELKVTSDTVFKTAPVQSSELPAEEKVGVEEGKTYSVIDYEDKGNHLLVTLAAPLFGKTEWYIFEDHIDLLDEGVHPTNTDADENPAPPERVIKILGKEYDLNASILEGGHMSWSEATKNGTRLPVNNDIVQNIKRLADRLEWVRDKLGNRRIRVNSWYRPPHINKQVGGASKSQHLTGKGIDITVDGLTPKQVQSILQPIWKGGLGLGATFTHLDDRNYRAVFSYGRK